MKAWPAHQLDIVIINMYAPNNILKIQEEKIIELKEEIDNSKITVADFNVQF